MYKSRSAFTSTEGKEKIKQYQEGNKEAGMEFISSIMPFVYREVRKKVFDERKEEYVSNVVYNLLLGMKRYDPMKGTSPLSYLAWWVKRGICNHWQKDQLIPLQSYSINFFRKKGINPFYARFEPIEAIAHLAVEEEEEKVQNLSNYFSCLTEKERHVMEALFEKNSTLAVVGSSLNLSKERVRQIKENSLKKIRKHIDKLDLLN